MAQAESFRWDQLPKPDFSAVGQWFMRFPQELRNLFNRSEEQVMLGVLFFSWVAGSRAGRQTNYCSFSQAKLGEQFGRSRWTVARALDELERLDLVRRVHRRPGGGKTWQTNLYICLPKLLRLLSVIIQGIYGKSPCSTFAPQVAKQQLRETTSPLREESSSLERSSDDILADFRTLVARVVGGKNNAQPV